MGSTYTSKILLSDEANPVVQCFKTASAVVKYDNKFLNIPYLQNSSALMLPLNSVSGCKGVIDMEKHQAGK